VKRTFKTESYILIVIDHSGRDNLYKIIINALISR
jgi:hypothetical protein